MKAIMEGASAIIVGTAEVVVAGGMESMSNAPYYLPQARKGYRMGNNVVVDGMVKDGLWDPYGDSHMGMCGEKCAQVYKIDRKAQDAHAIESYKRAAEAHKTGAFKGEIVSVTVPGARGQPPKVISEDEEYKNVSFDKLPKLAPSFKTDGTGTVTAGNASTINDGAAAFILMRESKAKAKGLKVLARILAYADAAQEPDMFTTAPTLAIPKAIARAGLSIKDIDFWEIYEAFSVVALANAQILGIDQSKFNIYGGAVALGHPIGCSGARIVATLLTVLKNKNARLGCAGICNGGGGASAIVIERVA
jgi:acetyl-CoA C-acetyltransferase